MAAIAAPLAATAADPGFVPIPPATAAALPPGVAQAVADIPIAPAPPVPEFGPAPAATVPGRVMVLQKSAGDTAPKDPDPDTLNPADVRAIYEQRYGKLPGKLEVFRLESESELELRILRELKRDRTPAELVANQFPAPPRLSPEGAVYVPKTNAYPPVKALIEPGYVIHRRLYFEDKNSERFGWDLGFAQPMLSALTFYRDVLVLPMKVASNPHERYDTSAGKCLPGSPVPYYLYPPEVDIWGVAFGAGIYTGTAFLFP